MHIGLRRLHKAADLYFVASSHAQVGPASAVVRQFSSSCSTTMIRKLAQPAKPLPPAPDDSQSDSSASDSSSSDSAEATVLTVDTLPWFMQSAKGQKHLLQQVVAICWFHGAGILCSPQYTGSEGLE